MAKQLFIGAFILLFLYIISPFAEAVGMGAVFAVLFYPWMKRIHTGRFPDSLAAGLFTLAVTVLLFLPVSSMIVVGVKSGVKELKQIKRATIAPSVSGSVSASNSSDEALDRVFKSIGIESALVRTSKVLPIDPVQSSDQLKDLLASFAVHLGDILSGFIGRIPNMAVAFSIFLFSLFYFLADGTRFIYQIRQKSFFSATQTKRLMNTFSGLCRSVILASIVSGGVQAFLAMCVCLAIGISQFPIVFLVVFIASFIPVVGAFPLLIGVAVFQFSSGHTTGGVVLAIAALVIASVDNFIRPLVIRGGSNLHPLLGFISALGGLEVFGVSGVFLGPVICGLCIEFIEVARE